MAEKLKVQVWVWSRNPADEEARVLLLKMREERGGFWQPITGSVEESDVDLEAAALREFTEETSLVAARAPKALGYEFTFASRWGGNCRESVFEVEVPWQGRGPLVKLDPQEHTDFRWLTPEEARKLLHFESNLQPLEILVRTRLGSARKKPRDLASGLAGWNKKN